ncbi:MAG: coiled-coil domain-containing protein [Candidatus Nanoarchaeia archaeon]
MGILDFLKNIVKEKEVGEIKMEKISFSEIGSWLDKKEEENRLREKEVLGLVRNKIGDFGLGIRRKIIALNEFDIDSKKAEDKLKEISNVGRRDYIRSVETLLDNLNDLELNGLEKSMGKINKYFVDFAKSSHKNYEMATILIGKEMANIKESLKAFSKELIKTFDENKEVIGSFKNISLVKSKLDTIQSIDKTLDEITEKILSLNEKLKNKEEESRILKQNLEEIKTSSAYLENLDKQKKIASLKEESKKHILELKQLLDFKALVGFFRINPDQLTIVKEHRDDFLASYQKDNGKDIIELLDESKLGNDGTLEKVSQIRMKKEEVENLEKTLGKDETEEVYAKIKEISIEIDHLKIEKVKEEKRNKKPLINKEELINLLKQDLVKLNVEVV